jgi:membrane-bound lytic murein transglycosylase B
MSFNDFEIPALARMAQFETMGRTTLGAMPLGGTMRTAPEPAQTAYRTDDNSFATTLQTATADFGTASTAALGVDTTSVASLASATTSVTGSSPVPTGCPECAANGVDPGRAVIGSTKLDWSQQGVPAGTPYAELFNTIGPKYGVDPRLLAAVAEVESSFNPTVTSPAGAQGLMQIMPGTAKDLGVNPWDPAQAVDGAARYLRDAINRFGLAGGLAAYNIGPGAVAANGGTAGSAHGYVDKVLSRYERSGR